MKKRESKKAVRDVLVALHDAKGDVSALPAIESEHGVGVCVYEPEERKPVREGAESERQYHVVRRDDAFLFIDDITAWSGASLACPNCMQRFARKLLSGENVTITAVGGSVTAAAFKTGSGYMRLLERWLEAALPGRPRPIVEGSSASGATIEYNARCAAFEGSKNPDLVIFEHATVSHSKLIRPACFMVQKAAVISNIL